MFWGKSISLRTIIIDSLKTSDFNLPLIGIKNCEGNKIFYL